MIFLFFSALNVDVNWPTRNCCITYWRRLKYMCNVNPTLLVCFASQDYGKVELAKGNHASLVLNIAIQNSTKLGKETTNGAATCYACHCKGQQCGARWKIFFLKTVMETCMAIAGLAAPLAGPLPSCRAHRSIGGACWAYDRVVRYCSCRRFGQHTFCVCGWNGSIGPVWRLSIRFLDESVGFQRASYHFSH